MNECPNFMRVLLLIRSTLIPIIEVPFYIEPRFKVHRRNSCVVFSCKWHISFLPSAPKAQENHRKGSSRIARARSREDFSETVFPRQIRLVRLLNSQRLWMREKKDCKAVTTNKDKGGPQEHLLPWLENYWQLVSSGRGEVSFHQGCFLGG